MTYRGREEREERERDADSTNAKSTAGTVATDFVLLKRDSATGTRTRVARVRAEYPNQLDYSGDDE